MRDRFRARPAALAKDRGPSRPRLADSVRDALVGAVVPRNRDKRRLAKVERAPKGRKELPRCGDRESGDTERPRELHEAGIAELSGEDAAEDAALVRLDDAEAIVDEDHADDRRAHALRRLELLDIHEEAAVTRERDDLSLWEHKLRRDRSGQGDAHRGETVGDDDRVRHRRPIEPREPHLVRSDIAHDDVFGCERLADGGDYLFRRKRRGRVFGRWRPKRLVVYPDLLVLSLIDTFGALRQRLLVLTDDFDRRLVVAVELGGGAVDVDDDLVASGIPERG